MPSTRQVRGILLDSGDTLVRPIGGRWWPPLPLRRRLSDGTIPGLGPDRLDQALQEARRYLEEHHHLATEDEEREQFRTCYRILFEHLGLASPQDELVDVLANATVEELEFEPYPDTPIVLERLHQRAVPLGVISNAWPSLESKYERLGLRKYFRAFVVSARVGCCKPDEAIYRQAIDEMGLPPEDLLFVDDVPEYVEKAIDLGMTAVVMARSGQPPETHLQRIRELAEVEAFV